MASIIQQFIKSEGILSVSILLNLINRLVLIQMNVGEISFSNILDNFIVVIEPELSESEKTLYAGIIYEAVLKPVYRNGKPSLRIRDELIGNDALVVGSILRILQEYKSPGDPSTTINHITKEMERFTSKTTVGQSTSEILKNVEDLQFLYERKPANPKDDSTELPTSVSFPLTSEYFSNLNIGRESEWPVFQSNNHSSGGSPSDSNGVVRFLAYIRKGGMDILFPQLFHDEVLLIIYTAVKCAAPLAHRDLMDMVCAIKDGGILPELESISKTKIRGIFALLKNSQSLGTSNAEGDAVRLFLGKGIFSFKEFREKHDIYLKRIIMQQRLFIPIQIKSEILWQIEMPVLDERLAELKTLELKLESFFRSRYGNRDFSASVGSGLRRAQSNNVQSSSQSSNDHFFFNGHSDEFAGNRGWMSSFSMERDSQTSFSSRQFVVERPNSSFNPSNTEFGSSASNPYHQSRSDYLTGQSSSEFSVNNFQNFF